MARLNYNRPNSGYESEPWRKSTIKEKLEPMIVLEHRAKKHSVIITKCRPGSVHAGAYRCIDCDKHLGWVKN